MFRLGGDSFARAYMALRERDPRALAAAVEAVRARCDGYVFVDPERGGEYPIVVEFAPFQKLPRHCAAFCEGSEPVGKPLKPDARNATIGNDEHFVAFLQVRHSLKLMTTSVFTTEICFELPFAH